MIVSVSVSLSRPSPTSYLSLRLTPHPTPHRAVVIDVLTRDAILNAKRKPRHSRTRTANKFPTPRPPSSSSRVSKASPAFTPTSSPTPATTEAADIDSPIPIRPYPFALSGSVAGPAGVSPPNSARHKGWGTGAAAGAGAGPHHQPATSGMRIGSLPAAIRELKTTPDNTPRYRYGPAGCHKHVMCCFVLFCVVL